MLHAPSWLYCTAPWLRDSIRREVWEEVIHGCPPNQISPLFVQYYVILEWLFLGADVSTSVLSYRRVIWVFA